jgi:hypothetical protein
VTRQSDALRDRLGRYVGAAKSALAHETVGILRETTPVDTGAARDGWQIVPGPESRTMIVNEEPHIRYLNMGSSSQAPAGFVEAAIAQAIENVRAEHGRRSVKVSDVAVTAPGVMAGGVRR